GDIRGGCVFCRSGRNCGNDGTRKRMAAAVARRHEFESQRWWTAGGRAMKLGLYSITYLGLWYRGEALPLPALITRAKNYGYDGIEIDGKRPHGNPLDWPTTRCRELRSLADGEGID